MTDEQARPRRRPTSKTAESGCRGRTLSRHDPGAAAAARGPWRSGPAWSGPPRRARARRARSRRRCSSPRSCPSSRRSLIVLSLLRRDDLLLRRRADQRLPVRRQVDAAAARRPAVVRRHPDHLGDALPDRHRPAGGDPARAPVRDLPLGVRGPAGPQGGQADPRDAGRRPDHRLRLLRPHLLHAERHPRRSASTSTSSTRCRPASSSASWSCRRSRRSPRTRCRRCPRRCARARSGSAPPSCQVSTADRLPGGAVGHRRRARARRLARRRRDRDHPDRRRPDRRTSASTRASPTSRWRRSSRPPARGDIPTGSIEYETIFAVGFTLFVHDAAAQRGLDPPRPRYRQVYE